MKDFRILFIFISVLGFFSCQKDDIDNSGDSSSTTFELKLDKNGMISSPKWLAAKVDSVAHSYKVVMYPFVLKITTRSDFYICVTGSFSSVDSSLYFHKNGKRIYNSDPLMAEIVSSTNREVIWSKYGSTSRAMTRTVPYPSASIYTPRGSLVPDTYYRPEELTPYLIADWAAYVDIAFPNAQILEDATTTYNCHGYAWSVVDGGETVWMGAETNPTSVYWLDGSYMSTTSSSGTKISYLSDNHSAVRTGTPNTFISKWGEGPLVRHHKDDCPYNSSSLSYFKLDDRPDIYVGQSIDDYTGTGSTIYSSSSHADFILHAYPLRATVNRYVWSVNFNGIYDSWYNYPNNDALRLSIYFSQPGNGGMLNVTCTMYNGTTLVGTANYSVAVVYQ